MTVYLLHFSAPIGNPASPRGQARHYIGHTDNLQARIVRHRRGHGAKITRAAVRAGAELIIVRTWPGDSSTKRRIKARKEAPRLCPICNPRPKPTKEIATP